MSTRLDQDLVSSLPFWASRILEIGDGATGRAQLRRNPNAEVVVLASLNELFRRSVTSFGRFDAIVLSAGLDASPASRRGLQLLSDLLTSSGRLFATITNGAHWAQFDRLLKEAGSKQTATAEQRVAFLTWPQAAKIFSNSGLRVENVRSYNSNEGDTPSWIRELSGLAQRIGSNAEAFASGVRIESFLVKACRAELPLRPSFHLHFAAFAPAFLYPRTQLPVDALSTDPQLVVTYRNRVAKLPEAPRDLAKIAVYQRVYLARENLLRLVASARANGWLLVYEIDDHPDLMAEVLKKPEMAELLAEIMSASHAVQTSTAELASVLRRLNPEMHIFRNSAFELPPFSPRLRAQRVFYGALNRGAFSAEIARALAPVVHARPELEFRIIHDRIFFEALPAVRKTFEPALDYPAYLEAMGASDVVLCPLEGVPLELFKSDIKFIEAARSGAAAIASPAVYGRTIRSGETGLIARDMAEWGSHLMQLADNPALRNRLARGAWDYVRTQRMAGPELMRLKQWYASLIERRDALDLALVERWPELRG